MEAIGINNMNVCKSKPDTVNIDGKEIPYEEYEKEKEGENVKSDRT